MCRSSLRIADKQNIKKKSMLFLISKLAHFTEHAHVRIRGWKSGFGKIYTPDLP